MKRSKQGKEKGHERDRGLFTADEGERGRGGWEDSDQLHADLQRMPQKKTSAWKERHTEKQKVRATVRLI